MAQAARGSAAQSLQISLDGQARPDLVDALSSIAIKHRQDRPARCKLTLDNVAPDSQDGYRFFDDPKVRHGALLTVTVNGGADQEIFAGRIDAIGARYPRGDRPTLVLRARDALMDLQRRRRSRRFEAMHWIDIVGQLAAEHGLPLEHDATAPSPLPAQVIQANETDLALLNRCAHALAAHAWVDDQRLVVRGGGAADANPLALEYGRNLLSFAPNIDLADQVSEVSVHGWDPGAKEAIVETDDGGTAGLDGPASGRGVTLAAFGQRVERRVHGVPLSADAARADARSRFARRARRFVRGRGKSAGDARIALGRILSLTGLGTWFDGEYRVTGTVHEFDTAHGYRTRFAVTRPQMGTTAPCADKRSDRHEK